MERWRSEASAYQGVIKQAQRKPLKQSQNGSIYRLNLSKSKSGQEHVFRLCSIFNSRTEKQQVLGNHHHDDEIKGGLTFVRNWSKGEMRLRHGQELSGETDSIQSYTKGMTIP